MFNILDKIEKKLLKKWFARIIIVAKPKLINEATQYLIKVN